MILIKVKDNKRMGWHYTLELECKVLPEFYEFFKNRYLFEISEYEDIYTYDYCDKCIEKDNTEYNCECKFTKPEYKQLPKLYLDLIDIWIKFDLGHNFYNYDFNEETGIFKCKNSKKVTTHNGYLKDDYMTILQDIFVPITSEIICCRITSDDYGDERNIYTDSQLRGIPFSLTSMVKSIHHKWEDGMIVETTVTYKRSIKKSQELDLDRCYGFDKI
jgi:hypothetical protein